MEIILTEQCNVPPGSNFGRALGYYIRSTKTGRVFSQRSKHGAPPDGHWRFIRACAEIAQTRLHIADIRVKQEEVDAARMEAGLKPIAYCFPCRVLDAGDVMYMINHCDL